MHVSIHPPIRKVVVAGANSRIGQDLLPKLKPQGDTVVGLVRKPATLEGADQVIADWMNVSNTKQTIQDADVIIALPGELFASDALIREAIITTTERLIAAMRGSTVRRIITLSYLGAASTERNVYLQANGVREKLFAETGVETVVFRCPAILNTPRDPDATSEAYTAKAGLVRMLGDGQQRQRPVYRGDVVQAILNALEGGNPGVYDLPGPEEMSADEMVRLINKGLPVRITHFPGFLARAIGRYVTPLTPTGIDIVLRNGTGDPARAVAEFGLTLTPLKTIWQTTADNQLSD